jgi:hypothetical protein
MMMIKATVDEITIDSDGDRIATLVTGDRALITLPAALLPVETRLDDVLDITLSIDVEETTRRRASVADLQRRLFG